MIDNFYPKFRFITVEWYSSWVAIISFIENPSFYVMLSSSRVSLLVLYYWVHIIEIQQYCSWGVQISFRLTKTNHVTGSRTHYSFSLAQQQYTSIYFGQALFPDRPTLYSVMSFVSCSLLRKLINFDIIER